MLTSTRTCAVLLLTVVAVIAQSGRLSAADEISGQFKGDGKDAKLAFVSAHKGDTFSDKPTFVIVMSEKDHSKDKKPEIKAGFGHYGSALGADFLERVRNMGRNFAEHRMALVRAVLERP